MDTENDKLQGTENESENDSSERTKVGFPQSSRKEDKKSSRNLIIILIVVLLLLGGGAWFLFGGGEEAVTDENTPTPTSVASTSTPTPTEQPEEVDKSEVSIQVLNGTGIAGAAGDLEDELNSLGYENIEVGNASTQNNKNASVSYDTGLPESIKDEITSELEGIYEEVVVETKTMEEFDVMIVTGYPKGHKVTATPTQKAQNTATPTGSSTSTTPTTTTTTTPTP